MKKYLSIIVILNLVKDLSVYLRYLKQVQRFFVSLRMTIIFILMTGVYLLILPASAQAANLYWVGNDGAATNVASNWKTTDPASCGGGDSGAAPSTGDVAIFDADCDNGAAITSSWDVLGVDMQSGYAGTVTQNAVNMTIRASGWTQAGGTFTGNSDGSTATITIQSGGDMNLTGGIFTSTNDTLTINDEWTVNGGTFTHNSGTVFVDAGNSNTLTLTGSITLNNLTFWSNCYSSIIVVVASGTTLTVSGTLYARESTSCGAPSLNGPGAISAQGNITTEGFGWLTNVYGGSPLTVTINGTGTQTWQGDTTGGIGGQNWGSLPAVTINKSSGTLILKDTMTVSGDFTYTQGTVDITTNNNTLYFMSTNFAAGILTAAYSTTISGSLTLKNAGFIDRATDVTVTIASGTTLTVTGNLELVELTGVADPELNGPGSLIVQGNLTTDEDASNWEGNIGITLSGSGNQTITQDAGAHFPSGTVTFNKTGGTVTLATAFSLSTAGQDVLVAGGSTQTITGAFNFTVADQFTISGALAQGTTTFINGASGGFTVTKGGSWSNSSTGDITIGSGGVTNNGIMTLGTQNTCGGSDSIALTSTTSTTARNWSGNGVYNFYDLTVTDQNESPDKAMITAWSSTATSSPNSNWLFRTDCPKPPVAYWGFEEGTGTSTTDSVNSVAGTLAGATIPTWQQENLCIAGKCLYYEGTASKVTVATAIVNIQTVGAWVRPNTLSSTNALIDLDGGTHKITYNSSGVVTATGFTSPTIYVNGVVSGTITANQWNYVEVTTGTAFSTTSSFQIATDGTNYTKGFIDEVKLYSYARSASEIKSDYVSRGKGPGSSQVLGANTQNMPNALSNGLVGYWKEDEASDASATDYSGNGNTLTDNNTVARGTGQFANGADFESSNTNESQSISNASQNGLAITGSITTSAWIKIETIAGFGNNLGTIISKYDESSTNRGYHFHIDNVGTVRLRLSSNGTSVTSGVGTSLLSNGTWYHVAGTYDGSNIRIYVNGRLESTTAHTGGIFNNTANIRLGAMDNLSGGDNFLYEFDGIIDEARVYNRALSGSEVSQLYNFAPGPVGYWDMNEGTGTTLADKSGNGQTSSAFAGNTSFTNGKYGKGLTFDGDGDNVRIPESSTGDFLDGMGATTDSYTVSAWAKNSDASESNRTIVIKNDDDGSGAYPFWIYIGGFNWPCFQVGDSFNNPTVCYAQATTDGKWHHYAGVRNVLTDTVQFYVDGVQAATVVTDNTTGSIANDDDISIGNGGTSYTGQDWNGQIDDVKIYSYARTPAQIIQDMNASHPAPGSPVGSPIIHYKLDEGAADTCPDTGADTCNAVPPPATNAAFDGTFGATTAAPTISTAGKFGKALDFDGSNDTLTTTTADPIDMNIGFVDGFTVSGWINPDDAGDSGGSGHLFSKTATTFLGVTNLQGSTLDISASVNLATDATVTVSSSVTTGTWNHVAMVWVNDADDELEVYVNGVLRGTSTNGVGNPSAESTNLSIGGTGTATFDGKIDEFKIYASGLTAEQIKLDMNQGKGQSLGALSDKSGNQVQSANNEYCIPGDSSTCTAPVGRWDFEEGSGTTANDTSTNGNTGTTTSTTWTNAKAGKALDFDTTAYIDAGSGSTLDDLHSGSFTAEAWIKADTFGDTCGGPPLCGYFLSKAQNDAGWRFFINGDSGLTARVDCNSANAESQSGTDEFSIDGKWHHVVMTYANAGDRKVYLWIDGKAVSSYDAQIACSGTFEAEADPLVMGSNQTGASAFGFDGKIDGVRIFNYARSAAQIAWDYNQGKPLAWWKLDECQGTTLNDSAGNSLSGTWSGSGGGNTTVGTCSTSGTAWGDGATGKKNYSLEFDGTDDIVTVTNTSAIQLSNGTISAWLKTSNAGSSYRGIVVKDLAYNLMLKSNVLITYDENAATDRTTGVSLDDGNWHHVAMSFQSGVASGTVIYIDGAPRLTTTMTVNAQTQDLRIGGNIAGQYFAGQIDDARVYNYALTAKQVQMVMNEGAVRYGPVTGAP